MRFPGGKSRLLKWTAPIAVQHNSVRIPILLSKMVVDLSKQTEDRKAIKVLMPDVSLF